MKATIENGEMVIRIPVNNPLTPSKSGKTMIVATSGGNQVMDVEVDGKPVTVGLNAYVKR